MCFDVFNINAENTSLLYSNEFLFRIKSVASKSAQQDLFEKLESQITGSILKPIFHETPRGASKKSIDIGLERWYSLSLPIGTDPEQIIEQLTFSNIIDVSQPNFLRQPTTLNIDSLRSSQWNLRLIGWSDKSSLASEIVVAIVDSGVDYEHPDLAGNIWTNLSELNGIKDVDDDQNGYIDDIVGWDFSDAPSMFGIGDFTSRDSDPSDESGHGTHVAGIIAAISNNRSGISGIAANAKLMVLRAGFNTPTGTYLADDDLAAAILYAVENGARIINTSWGSKDPSPLLRDVINYAAEMGVIVIAATGNDGSDIPHVPARFEQTIGVAASREDGEPVTFSNYGASVDLVAPGKIILSTLPDASYGNLSGTSMATPHVAGVVAYLLGLNPSWSKHRILSVLRFTSRDVGKPGWDPKSGSGLLQIPRVNDLVVPEFSIIFPPQDFETIANEVGVEIHVDSLVQWNLEWGVGNDPEVWNEIKAFESDIPEKIILWDTSELVTGIYQLRMRVSWKNRIMEDRRKIYFGSTDLDIRELSIGTILQGDQYSTQLEWSTKLSVSSRVQAVCAGNILYDVKLPRRQNQFHVIPESQLKNNCIVRVRVEYMGIEGPWFQHSISSFLGNHVSRWPLDKEFEFSKGYFLSQLTDFDANGVGEIVQMGYDDGLSYNIVDMYEKNKDLLQRVFTSFHQYIPWNVHDVDADGKKELMGLDARRIRLFESRDESSFPTELIWEKEDVSGGEVADIDGDGLDELMLLSSKNQGFLVFESDNSGKIKERSQLNYDGPTLGELGQRQIAIDMNNDGQLKFFGGDSQGTLFSFGAVSDNSYRFEFLDADAGDARLVGGGSDIDGDGFNELIVARFIDNRYEVDARYWDIKIYSFKDGRKPTIEWETRIVSSTSYGGGVGIGDINGDGGLEWIITLPPHAYLFTSKRPNYYQPVWYGEIEKTTRPLIGDIDSDGFGQLILNAEDRAQVWNFRALQVQFDLPAKFSGWSRDRNTIFLEWGESFQATSYRIYRNGTFLVETPNLSLIDKPETNEISFEYSVCPKNQSGDEGACAGPISVSLQNPFNVEKIERNGLRHLHIDFSASIDAKFIKPHQFRIDPQGIIPHTALPVKSGSQVVLGFEEVLPDSGEVQIVIQNLRGLSGASLDSSSERNSYVFKPFKAAARLIEGRILNSNQIVLIFDKKILDPEDRVRLIVEGKNAKIIDSKIEGNRILLSSSPEIRFLPIGRTYYIEIDGLLDADSLEVSGGLRLSNFSQNLQEAKPFPNPFTSGQDVQTFGFLPANAKIYIFDVGGQLVRILNESDSDGGVSWEGRNQNGALLANGIYYYKVESVSSKLFGTLSIIR